jgi:hypothetical protein
MKEKQQKYKRFIYPVLQVQYDSESLSSSKKALEKGLNYFAQGYIPNIKISEARGAMRVDARCWRSMRKSQDPHNLHVEIGDDKLSETYYLIRNFF